MKNARMMQLAVDVDWIVIMVQRSAVHTLAGGTCDSPTKNLLPMKNVLLSFTIFLFLRMSHK